MCELEADEHGEFISHTTPRARVSRLCDECGWLIRPGERYARSVSKWEGSISVAIECLGCVAWREAFNDAHRKVEGYVCYLVLGGLWESIGEFTREFLGYDPDVEMDEERDFHAPDPRLADHVLAATARGERA